jgi:tryptophan synthase beta chain
MSTGQLKYVLEEKDMPTEWYNIQADLPTPLPPVIHPGRMDPVGPDDLAPLFPPQLIMQEVVLDAVVNQLGDL